MVRHQAKDLEWSQRAKTVVNGEGANANTVFKETMIMFFALHFMHNKYKK